MFKKLVLVFVLVLAVAVGSTIAAEEGQECILKLGSKVFLMTGPQSSKAVRVGEDIPVMVGKELPAEIAEIFNGQASKLGEVFEFNGGNTITAPNGDTLVVKDSDLKDCK